jgi:hypothetical protein
MSANTTLESRTCCPACQSQIKRSTVIALTAPWVRELANYPLPTTEYSICADCGTGWVDLQYLPEHLDRIYSDYRGKNYFKIRNAWEPSYTSALNESMDVGKSYLDLRRASMDELIRSVDNQIFERARIVVDVGGGHGGLIPIWPNLLKKYVLDVSGVETEPGVEILNSWTELPLNEFPDFIMVCGLLEHLNNPREFLENLRISIESLPGRASRKVLVYFEVPSGVPSRNQNTYFSILLKISKHRRLWRILDQIQNQSLRKSLPLRIAEHVQFFTPKGMETLVNDAGYEYLDYLDYEANGILVNNKGIRFTNILGVVAQLK